LQNKYFYYHLVLIAQRKISVLATPVTSSNLHNQAPLSKGLCLLQGTQNNSEHFLPHEAKQTLLIKCTSCLKL